MESGEKNSLAISLYFGSKMGYFAWSIHALVFVRLGRGERKVALSSVPHLVYPVFLLCLLFFFCYVFFAVIFDLIEEMEKT